MFQNTHKRSAPAAAFRGDGENQLSRELRSARNARGENIRDISAKLRIRGDYLAALEAGAFDSLPPPPYGVAFLRSYARYLGCNADSLVAMFRAEAGAPARAVPLAYPLPDAPNGRRGMSAVVTASVILLAAIYGGSYLIWREDAPVADLLDGPAGYVTAAQQALQAAPGVIADAFQGDPDTAVPSAPPPANSVPGTGPVAMSDGSGASPRQVEPRREVALVDPRQWNAPPRTSVAGPVTASPGPMNSAPPANSHPFVVGTAHRPLPGMPEGSSPGAHNFMAAAPPAEMMQRRSAATAPETPPTHAVEPDPTQASAASAGQLLANLQNDAPPRPPGVFGAGEGGNPGRVVILARETSWIQIRSPGRDFVRTRTLEPGDRFVLPDRTDLALWTGNAGGIEILLDGQSLGVPGARGEVVKSFMLDPEALKNSPRG